MVAWGHHATASVASTFGGSVETLFKAQCHRAEPYAVIVGRLPSDQTTSEMTDVKLKPSTEQMLSAMRTKTRGRSSLLSGTLPGLHRPVSVRQPVCWLERELATRLLTYRTLARTSCGAQSLHTTRATASAPLRSLPAGRCAFTPSALLVAAQAGRLLGAADKGATGGGGDAHSNTRTSHTSKLMASATDTNAHLPSPPCSAR